MKNKLRLQRTTFMLVLLMITHHTFAQCSFTNGYTSAAGWTINGTCFPTCYSIGPSSFNFVATPGGSYDFATTTTPCTVNNACWCADIDFVYTARSTSGVAHTLLSLTSNALNSWNTGPTYAVSNNDVIEAYLLSPLNGPAGSEAIFGRSKLGTTWNAASTGIPVTVGNTYYIRLQRLTPTDGLISVFTNPARTTHAAGSPQCFTINTAVAGLSTLQHGAIPQAGPLRTMSGTLSNLAVNDVIPGITGPPSIMCGRLLGAYNLSVAPVCGASSYTWSGPSGFTVTSGQGTPNITASISSGMSGTVTCVIAFPGAACGITYTTSITHSPAPTVSVSASPSGIICFGSSTTLTASGTATSYSWLPTTGLSNPNIANPVASPTVTTTYTVTGTNALGCTRTATITVTVNPQLTAITAPDDTTCCGSITYIGGASGSASGGTSPYTYSWSPTTNIMGCTNCANPAVFSCSGGPGPVTYTLTVTDANGCTATNTVTIWFNLCRLANPDAGQEQQDAPVIAADMSIAPNPSNGNFIITLPGAAMHDVEVLNLLGEIVYSKSGIADASLTVDLSAQPKGVYFVKCREGGQIYVQQIILQ
jgi:hypothetical protein